MKQSSLFFLLLTLFLLSGRVISAQISHGGKPFLPPGPLKGEAEHRSGTAKSPSWDLGVKFFEMPAFDLDSVLREDRLNEGNMRRSYRFAHKFFTNIEKRKDAALTVLPDGTKIWHIYIRSKGAYSINVLLTNCELPPGGKLFVYSEDLSHVIGSFDYRNNSPEKVLPLQPVAGESIIIEYSEPADALFEGNFTVSEVNHDYRDFLRREPGNDGGTLFSCMPDALSPEIDENLIRSTVLLIIDGSIACSGVLVNNTENDGTPYILTAVHCLNDSLARGKYKDKDYYITHSGTVITFFNYNRPVCDKPLKGTEEMTMAETYPRAILERRDVALLELRETPPVHYNVYYAGWNMDESGRTGAHVNLHHPNAAIKKYGRVETDLTVANFEAPAVFDYESHWRIPGWTIGSTYGGSSGSPLFDKSGLVIGTLSGGASNCKNSAPDGYPDYFTILYKSWEVADADNQLKTYLDPAGKGLKQQAGMDPNKETPLVRLSNMDFSAGDALETKRLESPNSGYVYGSSNLSAKEFAEEFTIDSTLEILGVYLLVPPLPVNGVTGVEILLYSGMALPEKLLQTQEFSPKFLEYSAASGFEPKDKNMINAGTESFVLFDEPVKTGKGKFFISYKINGSVSFCAYNAKFADTNKRNTAWVKDPAQGWIQAVAYSPAQAVKTSLAIQPLVRGAKMDSLPEIPKVKDDPFFFDPANRIVWLPEPANETIPVNIYSLTGSLMEKTQINKGEKSVSLTEKSKGTIGIVQLLFANKMYSKKIIF